MSAKLKKKTLSEVLDSQNESNRMEIRILGKTLPLKDAPYNGWMVALNNLRCNFPLVAEHDLRRVFEEENGNLEEAILRLQRMTRSMPISKALSSKDEKAIESAVKREMSGLEQSFQNVERQSEHTKRLIISEAIDKLAQCESREQVEGILERLVDLVCQKTGENQGQLISKLKAQYTIAKKACFRQTELLSQAQEELRREEEKIKELMHENEQLHDRNSRLVLELKQRDEEGRDRRDDYERSRDVY